MRKQTLVMFSFLLAAAAAGCSAPQKSDDFSDLAVTGKADSFSKRMKLVGSLDYGQVSATTPYHNPPRYLAWKFAGQPGDVVDAIVQATDGIPDAWIVDNGFKVLGHTYGDAGKITVEATLTANTNPDIHTYMVIAREDSLWDTDITVYLNKKADPMFACNTDSDCVAVPKEMCCPNGTKIAVADGYQQAYHDAYQCKQPPRICPLYVINDTRVPVCQAGVCGLVQPPQTCGGIAGLTCPSGQYCKYDTSVCDPANGGADCGGTCAVCVQNVLCTTTSHFDNTVCKCVPNTCVDTIACIMGTHWSSVQCKCVSDTCVDTIACKLGTHWDSYQCTCVPG